MESLDLWTEEMLRLTPSTLEKVLRLGASVQKFVRGDDAASRSKRSPAGPQPPNKPAT